ncbi:MAG: TonB-dependent receptor [Fibrobacteria bacterium]|nr:TonB-dependent receptor [Fibrobacteria bacterium]
MRAIYLIFLLPLLFTNILISQENDTEDLMDLDLETLLNYEVTSTTKTKVSFRQAPGTIYTFTNSDINNYGLKTIDDLYWYIPNLQPYYYKKNNVTILRGVIERFNNRTQHIVDGVVARNGYYNHEELDDFIPLLWIKHYEMIIGPGSSLYGANAFSGISSIELLGFSEKRNIQVSLMSEISPVLPQATMTYTDNNFAIGLTGAYGEVSHPEYNITGDPFNQLTESKQYHGFLKYNLFNKGSIFSRYGFQSRPYINNKKDKKVLLEKSPLVVGLDLHHGDNTKSGLYQLKANHTIQKNAEKQDVDGLKETQNASFSNLELTYDKKINRIKLLFGISYLFEHADDVKLDDEITEMLERPNVIQHNVAGFGQSIINIVDPLTLTLGVRYDVFSEFDNKINGRAALVYSFTKNSTVKLLAGTATRTPSLREWNKDLDETSFVQPQLLPERLYTYEFSYNQLIHYFFYDITLFYNHFSELLLENDTPPTIDDPEGGADEYFYNSLKDITMYGVESNLKLKIKKLFLIASLSFITTDNGYDEKISYIREFKASFNASYNYIGSHKVVFGVTWFSEPENYETKNDNYLPVGEHNDFDKPEAFYYLNTALSGDIIAGFSYNAGIRNLTNQKVFEPYFRSSKYRNVERRDMKAWARLDYRLSL